jgi:hypothetical protein
MIPILRICVLCFWCVLFPADLTQAKCVLVGFFTSYFLQPSELKGTFSLVKTTSFLISYWKKKGSPYIGACTVIRMVTYLQSKRRLVLFQPRFLWPFHEHCTCYHSHSDRAIAQTVSRRLPNAAARVRSQVRSCGICGGQSDIGVGCLHVLPFPLPILILPTALY